MERDLEYENKNIGYDDQYPLEKGGGIKCKNYEICETVLPFWWYDCKECYICTNCDMMFGTWGKGINSHTGKGSLDFYDDLECPICLEVKRSLTQPNCEHTLCIDCFKRCYYGDQSREGEPSFPYPEIEDEYYDDSENSEWEINYPLIKIFNDEWDKWDNERQIKYENEEYLHQCPLCRK